MLLAVSAPQSKDPLTIVAPVIVVLPVTAKIPLTVALPVTDNAFVPGLV